MDDITSIRRAARAWVGVYLALRNGPYCILRTTGVLVVQHTITVGTVLLHAGLGICKLTPSDRGRQNGDPRRRALRDARGVR